MKEQVEGRGATCGRRNRLVERQVQEQGSEGKEGERQEEVSGWEGKCGKRRGLRRG